MGYSSPNIFSAPLPSIINSEENVRCHASAGVIVRNGSMLVAKKMCSKHFAHQIGVTIYRCLYFKTNAHYGGMTEIFCGLSLVSLVSRQNSSYPLSPHFLPCT